MIGQYIEGVSGLMQGEQVLKDAIESVVRSNSALVADWIAGAPKTWGPLAGKAVIAMRSRLGRNLTDGERRIVWAAMWRRLEELKSQSLK